MKQDVKFLELQQLQRDSMRDPSEETGRGQIELIAFFLLLFQE